MIKIKNKKSFYYIKLTVITYKANKFIKNHNIKSVGVFSRWGCFDHILGMF